MKRSLQMQKTLDVIFPEEAKNKKQGKCPFCKKVIDILDFKDELSHKEFTISGLCQKCQDETFGE